MLGFHWIEEGEKVHVGVNVNKQKNFIGRRIIVVILYWYDPPFNYKSFYGDICKANFIRYFSFYVRLRPKGGLKPRLLFDANLYKVPYKPEVLCTRERMVDESRIW